MTFAEYTKVLFTFGNFLREISNLLLVTDIMRLTGDVQAVVMAGGKVEEIGNLPLTKLQRFSVFINTSASIYTSVSIDTSASEALVTIMIR